MSFYLPLLHSPLLFLDLPLLLPLSSYSFFLICRLTFSLLRTGKLAHYTTVSPEDDAS